jgi:hypothetical protein
MPGWIGVSVRYGFDSGPGWLGLLLSGLSIRQYWVLHLLWIVVRWFVWLGKCVNELQVLSGFLFFSDAAQYYTDAVRLLEGFRFRFQCRHPMSTLLGASDGT